MTTINKIKAMLLGAAIIASAPTVAPAMVIAGASTDATASVNATLPEFIILHYYSTLNLNFATPTSEKVDENSNSLDVTWDGSTKGGELVKESLGSAVLELDGDATTVHIPNVWSVRGFASKGMANISVTIPEGGDRMVLGTSEIGLSNVLVSSEKGTGASVDVELNGIARSRATTGGIDMNLDFRNARLSGTHTGGKYTITASTI